MTYDAAAPAPSIARIDLTRTAPDERAPHRDRAPPRPGGAPPERGPLLAAVHYDLGDGAGPPSPRNPPSRRGRRLLARPRSRTSRLPTARSRRAAPVELPTPSASFRRWSQALTDYASTAEPSNSLAGWRTHRRGGRHPAGGRLGAGREHGGHARGQRRCPSIATRPEPCSSRFRRHTARRSTTSSSPPWRLRSAAWTGREAHRIDVEGHGREEWIGPLDVSRTVGWFTTPLSRRARSRGRPGRRLGREARQGRASSSSRPRTELRRSPLRVTEPAVRSRACAPRHRPSCCSTISASSTRSSRVRNCSGSPTSRRVLARAGERAHAPPRSGGPRARRPIRGPLDLRRRARPAGSRRTSRRRLHTALRRVIEHCTRARRLRLHPVRFPAGSDRRRTPSTCSSRGTPTSRTSIPSRRCNACSFRWRPEAAESGSSNGSSAWMARWTPRRCAKRGRRRWRATRYCERPSSPTWGTSRSRS